MAKSMRMLLAALAVFAVTGIVAAGCGSSDDGSSGSGGSEAAAEESNGGGGSGSGDVAAAEQLVEENTDLESLEYPEPPDEPYDPGSGRLGIVTCSTAGTGCLGMAKQAVAATEAAGWQPSEIGDGKFTPSVQAGIVQKYVQEGVDGILIASIDLASIKAAVTAAESAGIPMACVMCTPGGGFEPDGPVPLSASSGKESGELLGSYVVANSEPGETVLQFRDNAFPITIERAEAVKATVEETCDDCNFEEQQIATEELLEPGPPYFTAALASHPEGELGWAFAASDTYNIPGVKTIAQQGREVKVAGVDGEPAFLELMQDSPEIAKATVFNPFNYAAWAGIEQVIRQANDLEPWESFPMPGAIIDTPQEVEKALQAAPNYYSPPSFDYETMFKELWSGK